MTRAARKLIFQQNHLQHGSSNDVVIGLKKMNIGDFAPLFIKTPKVEWIDDAAIFALMIHSEKMAVEFDTKTDQFRFENDSIGVLSAIGRISFRPRKL